MLDQESLHSMGLRALRDKTSALAMRRKATRGSGQSLRAPACTGCWFLLYMSCDLEDIAIETHSINLELSSNTILDPMHWHKTVTTITNMA